MSMKRNPMGIPDEVVDPAEDLEATAETHPVVAASAGDRPWWAMFDPRGLTSIYGNWPLAALTLLSVIELSGRTAFFLLLPDIQRAFQVNLRFLFTLVGYLGIIGLLLSIPGGYMGDRYRRTVLSGIGGLLTSVGNLLTGILPGKVGLGVSRSIAEAGPPLAPVDFSLISDYYDNQQRGKAYSLRFTGQEFGRIVAPIAAGLLATAFTFRVPFLIIGAAGIAISIAIFFLPEPIRGYHERRASGADEETARRQQEPPSWGEAFRAANSVRTLRRIAFSYPLFAAFALGYASTFPLFLSRVFQLDAAERGVLAGVLAAVSIPGLVIGGNLVDRLVQRSPSRVVFINGVASIVQVLSIVGLALSPSLGVALAILVPLSFVLAIPEPAFVAVASMVIPPRLRSLGIATLALPRLIGLIVIFPLIGGLADTQGIRIALLTLTPLAFVGAIIWTTAAPYVEFDIRSATAAAMAAETWRKAKEAGRAKMLVIRDLDVRYEGTQVMFGVDMDVDEGELIALLGTNGAGKSTLLRAISGTQEATGGAIVFDGKDITHVPPHEIAREGIAQTPGGRGIFPGLSVQENLTLAGWLYGQDEKHAEEVEEIFGYFPVLRDKLDQPAGTLSGGEQQMLTLAQAFLSRPKLLMIDELSLGLAPAIVAQLLEIVKAINARGTTIIIVEQSVNVALTIARRAIFLEKGQVRFDGPTSELLGRPDIMRAVFIKGAGALTGDGLATVAPTATTLAEDLPPVLEVHGLTKMYGGVMAVDDVSFVLREGEVLGFIGPNGAGKTTVMEIVSGFTKADGGRVIYDGQDITDLPPEERARRRLIRRFQDARLFPSLTVEETLAVALERMADTRSLVLESLQAPQVRVAEQRIRRRADLLIDLFELGDYRDKFISELSTGSRRIVDLACVLATEPRLLILDEPSSGLAQRETENLAPLLQRVRRETGCSILIVEHDMPLISSVSDELVAMHLGRIIMRGAPDEVLEDPRVVDAYLGTDEAAIARSGA